MNNKKYFLTYEKFVDMQYTSKEERSLIIEKGQINVPKYDSNLMPSNYSVIVWSDDHFPPHFHYSTEDFEIKVDIITLEVIDSSPRKGISKDDLKSWEGLSTERKILKKWLKAKYVLNKTMTNYGAIKFTWNMFHPDILV